MKVQRDPERRLVWWEHGCAGEGDTGGDLELARAGSVLSPHDARSCTLAPGQLAALGCLIKE